MGKEAYPAGIVEALREKADVVVLDAKALALRAGSVKAMNIVLLGALVKTMDIRDIDWDKMIRKHVKKGFEDVNIKAFYAGYNLSTSALRSAAL